MTSSVRLGQALEERGELGRRLDHLLEVVEEQEQLALADVLGEAVLGAERLRDRLRDERGVAQRGEPDPEDACLVLGDERRAPPRARAASCPVPPGPGQRDEPRALLDPRRAPRRAPRPCRRTSSPDAAGSCSRSSSAAGSCPLPSWKIGTASAMSFSRCSPRSMSSSSTSAAVAAERTTWPPWPDDGDASGEVDVVADVALVREERRARVQADAHAGSGRRRAPR